MRRRAHIPPPAVFAFWNAVRACLAFWRSRGAWLESYLCDVLLCESHLGKPWRRSSFLLQSMQYALVSLVNTHWGTTEVKFFDSLRSQDGTMTRTMAMAQSFLSHLGLDLPDVNSAHQFQDDAWSCGIWAVHFMENVIWACHDELSPWRYQRDPVRCRIKLVNSWFSSKHQVINLDA